MILDPSMTSITLKKRLAFLPLTAILWSSTTIALSQAPAQAPASTPSIVRNDETVTMMVGDILEIKPVHDLQNPTYTWILTQDRTFIEASRSETFRKRLIQTGRYTLYAEVIAGDQSARFNRTFHLDYIPRETAVTSSGVTTGTTAQQLVTVVPATDTSDRTIIPEGSNLLRLNPVNPDIKPLALDLDIQQDRNGDGNPGNDIESDGTFFQSDASPLFLWFASTVTSRSISVTAVGTDGTPLMQKIEVLGEAYAREQGLVITPIRMDIRPIGDLQYSFSASFLGDTPTAPMLHHWEFGDGQRSILPNPTHTYADAGTYRVSLRIQNLVNGKEIAATDQELTVESTVAPASSAASEPSTETPPETQEPSTDATLWESFGSVALLGGIFLGSVLFGLFVIVAIMKIRGKGKGLSDHIAAMEANLIGKESDAKKETTPPPLTITSTQAPAPAPAPSKEEARRREEDHATTNPVLDKPLKVDESNAPAWLKGGLTGPSAAKPASAPAPAPKAPASQTPPVEKPKQPTPAWLQQKTPAAPQQPKPEQKAPPVTPPLQPKAPTPAPAVKPAIPVQQPPASEPLNPAPATAPQAPAQPAAVPSWLQQKPAPSAPSPAASQPATPPPAMPPAPAPAQAAAPLEPKPSQPAPVPGVPDSPKTSVPLPKPASLNNPVQPPAKPSTPPPAPAAPATTPTSPAVAPAAQPQANPVIPEQKPAAAKPEDQPVAFIRADSLEMNQSPKNEDATGK